MHIKKPAHPGKIIKEVLIEGANLSVTQAAEKLKITRGNLSRIINGHIGISPIMAFRLSKLLPNTDPILWINLQRDYDLSIAQSTFDREMQNPAFREQFEAEEREDTEMIPDPFMEKLTLVFRKPQNEREYKWLQTLLDTILDNVRDKEDHFLRPLMQIIGDNLEKYDDEHHPPISEK